MLAALRQIRREVFQIHHVRITACLIVDDGVEEHERIVARGVLVPDLRHMSILGLPDTRVTAGRRLARRVGAHVLHVGLPAESCGLELVRQRFDDARVDAARPEQLTMFVQARCVGLKSANTAQSSCVWSFGAWPLISAR